MGKYIPLIIILILVCLILFAIRYAVRLLRGAGSSLQTMKDMAKLVSDVSKQTEEAVETSPKSVGGATDLYLNQIQRDYPEFHKEDAEMSIRTFVEEYLQVIYQRADHFQTSHVDQHLFSSIEKNLDGDPKNVVVNKIAIYGYQRSETYATINYRVSFGYDLDRRIETRAQIDYTRRLIDRTVGNEAIRCSNCGAPVRDIGSKVCEYCGAKIVLDTVLSWQFTAMAECK